MQVGRSKYSNTLEAFRFRDKEVHLLSEIGLDEITTATSFVEYICGKYAISKSGAWYCLKKLKKGGVVEFTEKGEEYKPLRMTEKGLEVFRAYAQKVQAQTVGRPMAAVRAAFR